MSNSQLTRVADRERRDFLAKLRFALISVLVLPPLGATLTTLGAPRPVAAIVVFAGLAVLLVAFVVARVGVRTPITLGKLERRIVIAGTPTERSAGAAVAHPTPTSERIVVERVFLGLVVVVLRA